MFHRYRWASDFCRGRRVLEVACGTGQGLGMLARKAASVIGCDIEPRSIDTARSTHGDRIELHVASAERLPAADGAIDVVLLFEALYYLPDAEAFLRECRRVLDPGGVLLLSTTNKDLFDFVPSPFSHRYFGGADLPPLLEAHGFSCQLFGAGRIDALPRRHRWLRPLKAAARRFGLVPKTMRGKALVRRMLFGPLPRMPHDLSQLDLPYAAPAAMDGRRPDRSHRFLYAVARRQG
jgi:SAM-dependent methyltransferase